jgi:hypothetical protein
MSLKLNDEKLKSFEILMNRLKNLEDLEIQFPENTTLIELSDLLTLGG